jgi:uncharacterized surface protein with fasciclin (FAS1) repeats
MGKQNSTIASRVILTIIAALALSASAPAQKSEHARNSRPAEEQPESLFLIAEHTENLSVFFKAVKAAGMTDTLKGAGPFTVFAPTDEAFAKLPAEMLEDLFRPQNKVKLREILLTHIYATRATAAQIPDLKGAVTLKRNSLAVETSNGVKIGNATVTQFDINASNGVLHTVDTVLVPEGN